MANESGPERLKKKPRSLGRRLAMQYLYAADMNGFGQAEPLPLFFEVQRQAEVEAGAKVVPERDAPHWLAAIGFARKLIDIVMERREALDASLSSVAEHWDFRRIAAVERNILRVAAAELSEGEVDAAVVIDEAIRLAKLFGGKESGAFVNGVLDSFFRK